MFVQKKNLKIGDGKMWRNDNSGSIDRVKGHKWYDWYH